MWQGMPGIALVSSGGWLASTWHFWRYIAAQDSAAADRGFADGAF